MVVIGGGSIERGEGVVPVRHVLTVGGVMQPVLS